MSFNTVLNCYSFWSCTIFFKYPSWCWRSAFQWVKKKHVSWGGVQWYFKNLVLIFPLLLQLFSLNNSLGKLIEDSQNICYFCVKVICVVARRKSNSLTALFGADRFLLTPYFANLSFLWMQMLNMFFKIFLILTVITSF